MRIRVTRQDILRAKETQAYGGPPGWMATACPVALAIIRATGWAYRVGPYGVATYPGMKPVPLPRSVRRFVNRFDQGKTVKPFTFILKGVK